MKTRRILRLVAAATLGALACSVRAGSPYAGEDTRAIKALSEQEIADYLDGKGLGHARAAELNGYPGPRHVLDLARELSLTPEQIAASRALFESMQSRDSVLGAQLVSQETTFDRQFAAGTVDERSLRALVAVVCRYRLALETRTAD